MTRLRATTTHFVCSVAGALIIFALMWEIWYPAPYYVAAGGLGLFLILVSVDVIAGPAMTAVVFDPAKKSLKMDMSVIIALQVGILLYGLNIMWQARPVFVLAGVDRFFLVQASDLDEEDLAQSTLPEFRSLPLLGPVLAAAIPPRHGDEQLEMIENAARGRDVQYFPKYYAPFDAERLRLTRLGYSLDKLKPVLDTELEEELQRVLDAASLEPGEVIWYPLESRHGSYTLIITSTDASPLLVLPVSPWPALENSDETLRGSVPAPAATNDQTSGPTSDAQGHLLTSLAPSASRHLPHALGHHDFSTADSASCTRFAVGTRIA